MYPKKKNHKLLTLVILETAPKCQDTFNVNLFSEHSQLVNSQLILKLATSLKIYKPNITKFWLAKFKMLNFDIVYLAQFLNVVEQSWSQNLISVCFIQNRKKYH